MSNIFDTSNKLIKPKSNRRKFCRSCWREKERELWRENKRKIRNVQVQKIPNNPNISTFLKMKNIHKNTFYYSDIGTYNTL